MSWSRRERPTPLPKRVVILDAVVATQAARGKAAGRPIVSAELYADPANATHPHAPAILTITGRDADAAAATEATSTGACLQFAPQKHGNADISQTSGCVYRRRTAGRTITRPATGATT